MSGTRCVQGDSGAVGSDESSEQAMKRTLVIGMALAVAAGVGCGNGSDDNGNSAGNGSTAPVYSEPFSPCGGDLVGQWQITGAAVNESVAHPLGQCPGATATWTRFEATGTASFQADGTVVSTGSSEEAMRWEVPAACLGTTCAEFASSVTASMQEDLDPGDVGSFTCTDAGDGCSCTLSVSYASSTDTDTYVVNGSQLSITEPDGDVVDLQYCVSGDSLVMRDASTTLTFVRM